MTVLNIKTSDGQNFEVDWDVARQSQTVWKMVENLKIKEEGDGETTIPLSNEKVTGHVFKKALAWMEENRGKSENQEDDNELKEKGFSNRDQLNEWEKKYIEMPFDDMFPLLFTGIFLEIKGLIDLMNKAIALEIPGEPGEDHKWTYEELEILKDFHAQACHAWAHEEN